MTLITFIPGTKAKASEINANFSTLQETLNGKANKNGDSSQKFSVADADDDMHAVNKAQLKELSDNLSAEIAKSTTEFCVKSGYTTNGKGDLFSYSGVQVTPKIGTGFANLTVADYEGLQTTFTTAAAFSMNNKSDGLYNIFIKPDGTLYTLNNKIYKQPLRPAMYDGDIWLDTSVEPFKCIKYTSSSDIEFLDVPLGEIVMASNTITSLKTFQFNQNGYNVNKQTMGALTNCWVSEEFAFPGAASLSVTHNLNLSDLTKVKGEILAICKTAELGYSVGDIVAVGNGGTMNGVWFICSWNNPIVRTNTISYSFAQNYLNINGTNGMVTAATIANWKIIFRIWY